MRSGHARRTVSGAGPVPARSNSSATPGAGWRSCRSSRLLQSLAVDMGENVVVVDRDVDRWANRQVDETLLVVGGDRRILVVGLHSIERILGDVLVVVGISRVVVGVVRVVGVARVVVAVP